MQLAAFPASIDDEVTFERGTKEDNTNLWLAIRAFVANGAGATALELEYEERGGRLDRKSARFAVPIEAGHQSLWHCIEMLEPHRTCTARI